jgi:hypothetical protein
MSGHDPDGFDVPAPESGDAGVEFTRPRRSPQTLVERIKRVHEDELMSVPGVEGIGISKDGSGEFLVAYVRTSDVARGLPASLDGVELRSVVSSKISAL